MKKLYLMYPQKKGTIAPENVKPKVSVINSKVSVINLKEKITIPKAGIMAIRF